MSALRDIRARGAFREPQFVDLGLAHVPFDMLTGENAVEGPMLEAVRAGSSAAIVGARGSGKSSVLAWLCRQLPDDHVAIRVPVVGMDDPSDPAVLGSVALGAALEAARANEVDVSRDQREAIESARADDFTRRPSRTSGAGKLGGGPVPIEEGTGRRRHHARPLLHQQSQTARAGDRNADDRRRPGPLHRPRGLRGAASLRVRGDDPVAGRAHGRRPASDPPRRSTATRPGSKPGTSGSGSRTGATADLLTWRRPGRAALPRPRRDRVATPWRASAPENRASWSLGVH